MIPQSCSALAIDEPMSGTAPNATSWLLLDQPGPWGAHALTESRLDPRIGHALESRARGTNVRIVLIRRPGRHAHTPTGERRVYLAHTRPGHSWTRELTINDPQDLLDLDLAALGAGNAPDAGTPYEGDPLALVCTNGRRDRCCALLGRPLAAELATSYEQVWEASHLGGHRFSPTMLVLPHGYAYGTLTQPRAKEILEATRLGQMVPKWCRGRSTWAPAGQAAELALRTLINEDDAEVLTVHQADHEAGWSVAIEHCDGRTWKIDVTVSASEAPQRQSCGADPVPSTRYRVTSIVERTLTVGATVSSTSDTAAGARWLPATLALNSL